MPPTTLGDFAFALDDPGATRAGGWPFPVAFYGCFGHNACVVSGPEQPIERANGGYPRVDAVAAVIAGAAGLIAAWIAAGSTGLLGHPLRRAMTLLFLVVAILAYRPLRGAERKAPLWLPAIAFGAAAYLVTFSSPVANVMAVAVVLAYLAFASVGHRRDILQAGSVAVVIFGVYRFAITSVPWFWLAADRVANDLGSMAGGITGRPLWVGPTFAGLDFLVLIGVLWGLYLPHTKPPRVMRAIYGLLGILGAHMAYLVLLSLVPGLLQFIETQDVVSLQASRPLGQFIHKTVPWNFPAVACAFQVLVAAAMFRWSAWAWDAGRAAPTTQSGTEGTAQPARSNFKFQISNFRFQISNLPIYEVAAVLAAALLPLLAVVYPSPLRLEGKKVVFYEKGFLNWLKPTHGSYGRLSSGMYGMLAVFLESLGARPLVSPALSETDLEDADVLAIIYPDEPWQQGQLERIHDFVRRGGSLLVFGEHTTRDPNGNNRFNEVLAPTAMRIRFDCATFAVGGWLQSYDAISHPTTAGIGDDENQFGVVIGASVDARWPSRPLLIGRWGWTDIGDDASDRAMMGNDRYDPGEKLGDVILAAEQPMGKGRIIAFGDTSGLTNAIDVSSYVFTSRLFAYLAGAGAHAHAAWRQILSLLAGAFLIALVCARPNPAKTSLVALGLALSLSLWTFTNQARTRLAPEGRRVIPNNLAYIDSSHIEAYSSESWRTDGIGGLALTLMRNGYLTLDLPELTPDRLLRAGLLVSVAPSRPFSAGEVGTVKDFVNGGGILILTAGYDQSGPSRPLLDAFGLHVGTPTGDSPEPEPLGHFKSPYLESQDRRVYVRFHAAWPVAGSDPNTRVIAYGRDNRPVAILRRFGAGKVLLVGDTCFAMNINLEWENGAPFEGLRENADFWRWLLSMLRDQQMWIPPALQGGQAPAASAESGKEAGS